MKYRTKPVVMALRHLATITLHKWFVMIECFRLGLYWQGITHDLSKYSLTEFLTSARYFQGNRSPIGAERAERGYSLAWLHHKACNKHHWEYWTDFTKGKQTPAPIPEKYVKEMFCDLIGASKAYKKAAFRKDEPLKYFLERVDEWVIHEDSKSQLEKMLREYVG